MMTHLGAVLTHAQWPGITCHELYEHSLLEERIDVVGGYVRAPDEPGLGVKVDEAALEEYRVDHVDLAAHWVNGNVVRSRQGERRRVQRP